MFVFTITKILIGIECNRVAAELHIKNPINTRVGILISDYG